MKKKLLIILLIAVFIVLLAAAGYYLLFSKTDNAGNSVADNTFGWKFPIVKFPITGSGDIAYSDIRDPGGIPQGLPVRLQIPSIGVDSAVEDALITPDGRMDVPQDSKNVAWFALGPHPGQVGSAVIGGHFGVNHNIPFVFYKLDRLKVGDKAYILDDKGQTLAFVVRSIKLFDRNGDATTVFTSSDGLAHLNLITCEGIWNQVKGTYPERRVVFTDQIPLEGAAPVSILLPIATVISGSGIFARSLTIGSQGQDVLALQTFLEQKGFLVMPSGVSKGLFGALTRAAVAKYQASVGLPSQGLFGPLTIAKISLDLGGKAVLPDAGAQTIPLDQLGVGAPTSESSSQSSPYFFQVLIGYAVNLFKTPLDALVTIFLLISIGFIAFKIIS